MKKIAWAYLHQHRKGILLFVFCCLVFAIVFGLYELPVAAVAYGAAICCFFTLVMVAVDFLRFYQKHRRLQLLWEEIKLSCEGLPEAAGLLEQDYQQLLHILWTEKQELAKEMNLRYADLVDYYTIWAHQIKTPIAAMRLHLQNEDSAFSRSISFELLRIEQYVEMVLGYLRLDADSSDYVIQYYDLDAILKQSIRKFSAQFIQKKIRLDYRPVQCQVLTDEKWLAFVIEQVLSNALKYTKSGGVITIAMPNPMMLCIRDTGIGIAPEDLPRIFEKGYTGYNGRLDKKASGIGLYLCRRICDNLGHRIWANSSVNQGTVIWLDLKSAPLEVE